MKLLAVKNKPRTISHVENHKHQITNPKWFDKLTTLSKVEGQISMTEIQISKQTKRLPYNRYGIDMFWSLELGIWILFGFGIL